MRVLKTTPGEVLDVAFSPDCRAIAAAVEGAGVFLWNLDSPNIAPVRLEVEGGYSTGGLGFSADGRQLAWLTATGRRTYDRDTRTATTVAYPGVAAPGMDQGSDCAGTRTVSNHSFPLHCLVGWNRIWDEWVRHWSLSTRDLFISSLTLNPAGDQFAMFTRSGERDPWRLEIRDAATSAERTSGTYLYSYAAKPLRFHPAGEQIAALHEMTLLVWSLPTGGDPRLVRNADSRKHFTALAYHPSGERLYVTSNDKTVHVFDAHTLERTSRYTWHLDELSAIAVSSDGTLAAAGSAGGDVVVWDLD
jgi:WD40 repeat protein